MCLIESYGLWWIASSSIKVLTFQEKSFRMSCIQKITLGYASFFQHFFYSLTHSKVRTCIVYIMTMQNVINQLSDMICECSQLLHQRYRILSLLFMQMGFISMRIYRNITTSGNVHIERYVRCIYEEENCFL